MRRRIVKYLSYKGISKYKFYQDTGLSNGYLDKNADLNSSSYEKISSQYKDLNMEWVRTGEGEMLKNPAPEEKVSEKTLIPFYSNVVSVGGINERIANVDEGVDAEVQMIDTGDWFRSATSAIVQYGDSMVEYPHGSILAVRRLTDFRNITTGKSYVIETNDYRVTKQLVDADPEYFLAYSTNKETRPDGSLIHAPFRIYKELIRHIDIVLGCVSIEEAI